MSYYNNVNPTILELVSPTATSICEFGCGAGALARAIRLDNPTVHYVGVEIEMAQLELAKDVLDIGLHKNLDRVTDWALDAELCQAIPLESFDHIILGDVLEHLYDPQNTLNQAAKRLRPGGCAIVCIPNVQHWSVFAHLVAGNWPQEDAGLFDRTHIRWFTVDDMVRLVSSAGLEVESIHPRIFPDERGLSIMEDLEALALNIGTDPVELIDRGLTLQYVLVGRKGVKIESTL